MDFFKVLPSLCHRLDEHSVQYALIGGFAMAMRGVQRATLDLDFILALEDLETTDSILKELSFERLFHSENVSHYRRQDQNWRVNLLHAFRKHRWRLQTVHWIVRVRGNWSHLSSEWLRHRVVIDPPRADLQPTQEKGELNTGWIEIIQQGHPHCGQVLRVVQRDMLNITAYSNTKRRIVVATKRCRDVSKPSQWL